MLVFLAIIVSISVLIWFLYASIIRKRNKALEAFSGIDVQLKKRHDLIPNILTIAKRFMEHEKELLTEITRLRTAAIDAGPEQATERFSLESALQGQMGKLMIAVENYPDLKSDETMIHAQRTYSEVEAHISAARRFYNSAVNALNNAVQIWPSSTIARMIGIDTMPLFEVSETERAPVAAGDFL
jgi:LemA protein